MSKLSITGRARVWTFISYPESMPTNWKDLIDESHVEWIVSPLHDRDLINTEKPEEGFKKAHYHHMIMFGKVVKSFNQVKEIIAFLNVGTPESEGGIKKVDQVHSSSAMVRYFVHKDQPKKAQYLESDIENFNGADWESCWVKNDKEVVENMNTVLSIISENGLIEFKEFIDWIRKFEPDLFLNAMNNQYFYSNYIRSYRHMVLEQMKKEDGNHE